jgi:predicted component of viral defense system (DUF524 family)
MCRSREGREVARILIVPVDDSALAALDRYEAYAHNEAEVQLVENGHYEYLLISNIPNLRVSCRPVFTPHTLQSGADEHGAIETGSTCGQLRIDVTRRDTQEVVGIGAVEVRSVKLGYRDQYRQMLNDIVARLPGLLFDARVPAQMPLTPAWPRDAALLQQQVAFLCEAMDALQIQAAMQRILASPHQQLQRDVVVRPIQRAFNVRRDVERQLTQGGQRVALQPSHQLVKQISSLPARVAVPIKHTSHDTPENQFVKHALQTFEDFLRHAETALRKQGSAWQTIADRAHRVANALAHWRGHVFFRDVSPLRLMPFSSHVLQRKAGYRDVLKAWSNFHAGVQLRWAASDDLFRAGQRDVAALYEYWLFFQLLDWFCGRFDVVQPAKVLVAQDAHGPMLTVRQGFSLGPFEGRRDTLRAQFSYNRMFGAGSLDGSWTRPMRPDFTFTFWRGDVSSQPMHLHFDAKYRVNTLAEVFAETTDDASSNANRDDMLKMHAYRDAIRNTAGAYVLYPGNAAPQLMRCGDGLLPGLGAFAVSPGGGMAHVAKFLEAVILDL